MTPTEIISEIIKLPTADWETIKKTVDTTRTNGEARPEMTEDEFAQYLLAKGVISSIPTGETDEEFDDFDPVTVAGEPLSEVIIRERR
ncbi:MAG: hypothetical protein ACRD6X_00090 [Pyrinomonadaceae bacterium]